MPKVNVTIPTYNCGETIVETFNSIISQDYPDYGVTIIDDGSTDNTEEIVTNYIVDKPNFTYIKLNPNGGVARARNLSLLVSDYEMLTFQDADDLMLSGKISKQVEGFNFQLGNIPADFEHRLPRGLKPDVDIVTCRVKVTMPDGSVEDDGDVLNLFYSIYPNVAEFNKPNSFILMIMSMYHKRVFEELGGFVRYRAGSDSEFKDRCLCYGMNIRHVNETLFHYIRRPVSITSNTNKQSQEFIDMHRLQVERANEMKSTLGKENFLTKFAEVIDLQDIQVEKIINKQNLVLNRTIPATEETYRKLEALLA